MGIFGGGGGGGGNAGYIDDSDDHDDKRITTSKRRAGREQLHCTTLHNNSLRCTVPHCTPAAMELNYA